MSCSVAECAAPWHLEGWGARAVVEIPSPLANADVDTAGVKVLCQGHAKADGSDYRVLDAAGKPVAFQIMFHDAARYSLISFRVKNPREQFFIYFDNPKASHAAEEVVLDPALGAGPPKGEWIPRYGLAYATVQRPEGENPNSPEEMTKLLAASPFKHGARYQQRISDGFNPFGSSDYYMSVYRGWMRIPQAGKYWFCTASNEASFSFMDGKPLIHWPGRHTVDRGIHGEKNAMVELSAGLHYVEYYHEEVTLQQMAFLGWRLTDSGAFGAIPESVFTAPHAAVVTRYEQPGGVAVRFEPVVTDSVWPKERHEGQYTRCHFKATGVEGGNVAWDFGDGQTASGAEVDHVYVRLGNYPVKMQAGNATVTWPLWVFEIENVTDQVKEGSLAEYTKIVKSYDRAKLDPPALTELAHLLAESGESADAMAVAKQLVGKVGDSNPKLLADLRRLIGDCAGVDEAIVNYQAALAVETTPYKKIDLMARLIKLFGLDKKQPDKVEELLGQVEKSGPTNQSDDETWAAYRRAIIAGGDVRLWTGKRDEAQELYKRAEVLARTLIPPQVRDARLGAFPNSMREYLAEKNFRDATDLVEKVEWDFPTTKVKGQTFFWRGKTLAMQEQHAEATRYMLKSLELAVGANFETEARWLLAESLEKSGQAEQARKELAKLVATGLKDRFTELALEKLKQTKK